VARLNGDEFAVVLIFSGFATEAIEGQIRGRATALRDAMAAPSQRVGQALSISVNMGLALLDGQNGDELLRQAYAALQIAKQAGQHEPVVFASPMQADAERKLRLEADLRAAISGDALQLVYQTQVDRRGMLVGAEALLRWDHPEHGSISPAEFVRVAETSGQMSALGAWVIRRAFATLAALPATAGFRLSVNISPWQLFLADFLDTILTAIRDSNVDPNRITLEITETAFIHDIRDAAAKIRALGALGIRVSIDDFGTGYASIASLKAFLVHELKIDQSFIHDMSTDQPDRFVAAMIALGRALDLHVVAEGVEHAAQREALLRMGCDAFQGYLIGRPVATEELARQLRGVAVGATVS
jgi:EAL domain-containing protein (putative c-di-GMP-specific phosphodiesterase class I)